ncbi:DUF2231 domain-containing protein [Parasphingorhabdus sp.]|uniref:DUF2231 domain-containing protein n=1 Tax=Parasphingorhabdus sp. TaxID=2709688 RepID=UPI0030AC1F84
MTKCIASLLLLLLLLIVAMPLPVASAHEAHRKDMSDADIVEMRQAAETAHDGGVEALAEAAGGSAANNGAMSADIHGEMIAGHSAGTAFSPTDFLGRLHPALVHFPIALFLAAGLAELILFARPESGLEPTVRFLIYTGAAGGVIATLLGWLAGGIRMSDRSETLGLHRWTGTGIALAGVVAAIIIYREKSDRMLIRLLLAGIATALLFQSYWGAEMSLGPNHMNM